MPVIRNAHHIQLPETPPFRTRSVTRFGVSVEKVVATIDVPSSHHGRFRPPRKNWPVPEPARRANTRPTANASAP